MRHLIPILISMGLPAAGQVGLGLSPMRVELALEPGKAVSGALDLMADTSAKVRVRGELLDFAIDEQMTPQFARSLPGEAGNTCRGWLTVNPMETEVESGGHVLIRYTLRVPAEAAPRSYYCAAGFTALPPAEKLKQTGIRTTVRVVAAFYVVVGRPAVEAELSGLSLEEVKGPKGESAGWRAVVRIRNSGDRHVRPEGVVRATGAGGEVLEELQIPSFPALPQREQRYLLPLKKARGEEVRQMKAEVDLGGNEIQRATVSLDRANSVR